MPLCFAYGSNMDRTAMAARCPGARPLGLARLARHRLAIMREGYLTVVRDPRGVVHGLLWDVPLSDLPALDRYEGVAERLYVKRMQAISGAAGLRKALVYVGVNTGPGLPRAGYLEGVLAAARDVGLPGAALAEIAALGEGRRAIRSAERPSGPVAGVRPVRATPLDPEPRAGGTKWTWTP